MPSVSIDKALRSDPSAPLSGVFEQLQAALDKPFQRIADAEIHEMKQHCLRKQKLPESRPPTTGRRISRSVTEEGQNKRKAAADLTRLVRTIITDFNKESLRA